MEDSINIKFLGEAHSTYVHESFIMTFNNDVKILVDSGNSQNMLKSILETERLNEVNVVLITHVDQDHIKGFEGLLKNPSFLKNNKLEYIIFNYIENPSGVSYKQAISLKQTIDKYYKNRVVLVQSNLADYDIVNNHNKHVALMSLEKRDLLILTPDDDEVFITFITPTQSQMDDLRINWYEYYENKKKEDSEIINNSCICVLIEYKDIKLLLTGDQSFENISQVFYYNRFKNNGTKIKRYKKWGMENKVAIIKIPHHGSSESCSTLSKFAQDISCNNFFFFPSSRVKHSEKTIEKIRQDICNSKIYSKSTIEQLKDLDLILCDEININSTGNVTGE